METKAIPVRNPRAKVAGGPARPSTRERILDVALDLFVEKGFDKSSLREIAEQLGFSKAAIYYHFASKDEILMGLHERLDDIARRASEQLGQLPAGVDAWAALLDELVSEMLNHRKIFVMFDRNRSAFEQLHRRGYRASRGDFDDEVRRLIADPSLPVRDRVRMASAIGAVLTTLVIYGDLLHDVSSGELAGLMRDTVGDLLGRRHQGRRATPRPPRAVGPELARPKPSVRKRPRTSGRAAT